MKLKPAFKLIDRFDIQSAGKAAGTDKVIHHAYERFYANFLSSFDGSGSIVEIGYGQGKSVELWKSLYPTAFLYILDRKVELEGDGYRAIKCDQSSTAQLSEMNAFLKDKNVSVIIDDGSHNPDHQLLSFNSLFDILEEGGVYIIEDIECSYWKRGSLYGYETEYGLNSNRSLINKLRMLPHWINREFLSPNDEALFSQSLLEEGFNLDLLKDVASVSFAQNCLAITKCFESDRQYHKRKYRHSANT